MCGGLLHNSRGIWISPVCSRSLYLIYRDGLCSLGTLATKDKTRIGHPTMTLERGRRIVAYLGLLPRAGFRAVAERQRILLSPATQQFVTLPFKLV